VKFLVDNQLPPALARFIELDLGASATHVTDIGLRDATDSELWSFVSQNDSILISKDDDFVRLVLAKPTARLIWVRIGNCRRQFLLDVFRRVWPRIVERLERRDTFIEIR
jgi:predicted nuclease of predicted toxin-antitoxin system